MEKFSVLMSVYIREKPEYLEQSIKSIINQTAMPDEIIIVKDGPLTKDLEYILNKYSEIYPEIIRFVVSEENIGLGLALKLGLNECTNELVARMDTDDISLPYRFEKQLITFNNNQKLDILSGGIVEFIGEENNIVGRRELPTSNDELKEYIKRRCPLNHVAVMFKKSKVIEAGGYQDWFWNEDYFLWIRMYKNKAVFGNLSDDLVKVRVGDDMYKRRGGIKYFKSEMGLQNYMLKNNIISYTQYFKNIIIRFLVQVLMPSTIRGYVFKKFART